jgi:signal peptidase II
MKLGLLGGTFMGLLPLDQWTKYLIHKNFRWGESMPVLEPFFSLTYVRNQGAAFGLLHSAPTWFREPFFLVMPLVVMALITLLFMRLNEANRLWRWWGFGYSLVLTGAVGNIIDRTRFGYVIDFLDFHWKDQWHYPAFNVADSSIVIGVGLLFLLSYLESKHPKRQAQHE